MSVRVGDEIVAGGQGDMYTKAQVDALIANAIAQTTEKPGMIKPFAGTTVPTGYLLCDGSAVSRTTYANLFAAIGTTYGSGDGSTTFNLPNSNDRVLQGNGTRGIVGTQLNESLPNIKGGFGYNIITEGSVPGSGAISTYAGGYNAGAYGANYTMRSFSFSASFYSGVYQDNAPVQQNALCVNYIIKY